MDAATLSQHDRDRLAAVPSWRLLIGGMLAFAAGLIGSERVKDCAYRIVGNTPDQHTAE